MQRGSLSEDAINLEDGEARATRNERRALGERQRLAKLLQGFGDFSEEKERQNLEFIGRKLKNADKVGKRLG